jgi:protein farnesyltransferase subunit beta
MDLAALESWLLRRQGRLEGGFNGRTNKLVDACYSFWQGAALAIVDVVRNDGGDLYDLEQWEGLQSRKEQTLNKNEKVKWNNRDNDDKASEEEEEMEEIDTTTEVALGLAAHRPASSLSGSLSFNQLALQRFVLHCSQNVDHGGLKDKPGKMRDFYHSCYSLSGLAVAQSSITCPLRFDYPLQLQQTELLIDEHEDGDDNNDNNDDDDVDNLIPNIDLTFSTPQVSLSLVWLKVKCWHCIGCL